MMTMMMTNNNNNNSNNSRTTTRARARARARARRNTTSCLIASLFLLLCSSSTTNLLVVMANDDGAAYDDAAVNNDDDANADDAAAAYDDANAVAYDDGYNYYNGGYGNENSYYDYNGDDDTNDKNNANANGNYYYDDNYENNLQYADDDYTRVYQDDFQDYDADVDGFDGVSIMPVSCVNYNNGHMIKFEIYETANSYQCHFARIGTFVVSIAHYMRAFYNYRALVDGKYFSLPEDVGYLNCIPLKLDAYWQYGERFGSTDDDNDDDANNDDDADANDDDNEEDNDEEEQDVQNILYAKVGCMARDTFTSAKFQLHVYTDNMCTNPYDDGQTSQQQASKGYEIDFNSFYTLGNDDDNDNDNDGSEDADDANADEDQETNILQFSTNVSFRPTFYQCQNCKPDAISETFNKFSGSWYDDAYISEYGEKQVAEDDAAYAEEEEEEEAAECNNCQYYHYSADDAVDAYNSENGDGSDDANSAAGDDAYAATDDASSSAAAVDDAYYNAVDDAYMYNTNDDGGRRTRRLGGEQLSSSAVVIAFAPQQSSSSSQQIVLLNQDDHHLIPAQKEFMKFEFEFWKDVKRQREHRDRQLYDNQYGGVDDWNMCEQVYKYGLYCDEQCQALDAFTHTQWSSADIALLSIMVTFMAAMMLLVVAKRLKASRSHRRQRSFFINNNYDPQTTSITPENMPGIPPLAMFIIFTLVMITIITLSILNFVNETLVFAVVCCILLFIYMLKLTLFHSPRKQPVLLASPNHEDVFGYGDASVTSKDVFFS